MFSVVHVLLFTGGGGGRRDPIPWCVGKLSDNAIGEGTLKGRKPGGTEDLPLSSAAQGLRERKAVVGWINTDTKH